MSYIVLEEQATPATPAANQVKIYPKAGGGLYILDDLGVETPISQGAGDMLKSVYDVGDDGVVDSAESIDGGVW
jgi:hypothetical protein